MNHYPARKLNHDERSDFPDRSGYHTPWVAPKGKDGGIDIRAYHDPLGAMQPRIKVQVKHRDSKANPAEVRALAGVLGDGEIGLFVSSGGFTPDAVQALRNSQQHIEKMDLDDLINHWQQHYENLEEEDRALLPMRSIMFLAPED